MTRCSRDGAHAGTSPVVGCAQTKTSADALSRMLRRTAPIAKRGKTYFTIFDFGFGFGLPAARMRLEEDGALPGDSSFCASLARASAKIEASSNSMNSYWLAPSISKRIRTRVFSGRILTVIERGSLIFNVAINHPRLTCHHAPPLSPTRLRNRTQPNSDPDESRNPSRVRVYTSPQVRSYQGQLHDVFRGFKDTVSQEPRGFYAAIKDALELSVNEKH
jgi:hypothetical protein